jgi:TPR repeat protein
MFENGRGVAQSDEEAFQWYSKAADQGYARAKFNLGLMFENGRGVAQSDEEAVQWYRKAADQGHLQAQARLS